VPLLGPDYRRERRFGKINFVEQCPSFHLYHSFDQLWIVITLVIMMERVVKSKKMYTHLQICYENIHLA